MRLDDDEDSDVGVAEEAEALLLPKARSRSRSHVAQRVASMEPAVAGSTVALCKLVYGKRGKVSLSCLNPRLASVVRAAVDRIESSLYLVDAFPDRVSRHKFSLTFESLQVAAKDCEEPEILEKLEADSDWARELMSLVSPFCHAIVRAANCYSSRHV